MRNFSILALLLPLRALSASSESLPRPDTSTETEEVVVTGTREPIRISLAPVSITRLEGHDFESIGTRHQADLFGGVETRHFRELN